MARAPTNVRPDPSSFVGRGAELARLQAALESANLVSLTGPPGVGKSRLAKELALVQSQAAWFCDLSVATGAESIAARVASVLDLPLAEGRSAKEAVAQIGRALSRRGAVSLILDDFEHLIAHAESTLGVWLRAAPRARFVVTTRQRLGLAEEHVIELRPLGPDAVQLFVERARAVRRSFEPSQAELAVIARIVERLDGLPLAIELAAARAGVLGVRQLLERLEGSFAALDRGERSDRSTLRGALQWSWELSSERERQVLLAVSACVGGFDARAAEALTALDEPTVLDALEALVGRSLLPTESDHDEIRFRMLTTVRELAQEKLAQSGLIESVHRRHADHYLALGKAALEGVDGPRAAELFARLQVERENLLAVARRGLAESPLSAAAVERALGAVLALERLCIIRDPVEGYLALLERALEHAPALGVDRRLVTEALRMRGSLCLFLGRPSDTERDTRAALAIARELGDVALEARLLAALALTGLRRVPVAPEEMPKRRVDARHAMEEALELYPHRDARRGIILNNLGVVLEGLGDWEEAERRYDEAVACYRNVPCQSAGVALASRGALHHASGRLPEAEADLRRALEMLTTFGDRRSGAYVHAELGALHVERGLAREARAELEACLVLHAEAGLSWYEGTALATQGDLELGLGDTACARERYAAALEAARSGGDGALQVRALAGLSSVLATEGSLDTARETLGAAAALAADAIPRALVDAARGQLALAEARALPSTTEARDALDHVRALVEALGTVARTERSAVVRSRAQWLERCLVTEAERRAASGAEAALRVTADGKWFRWPGGEGVFLHRRPALALVLAHLVRSRIDAPAEGVALEELFAAGWPGERIDPHSAAMRVHQAVATLRKLGLRAALLRKQDGYLLDPSLPVTRVAKPDA